MSCVQKIKSQPDLFDAISASLPGLFSRRGVINPKNAVKKMLMLRKNLFFDTLVNVQLIVREIFLWKNAERYFNEFIELNKFLNNVCIVWVNHV